MQQCADLAAQVDEKLENKYYQQMDKLMRLYQSKGGSINL
jgi:hypothetical protein